jgi:hypothetical protein
MARLREARAAERRTTTSGALVLSLSALTALVGCASGAEGPNGLGGGSRGSNDAGTTTSANVGGGFANSTTSIGGSTSSVTTSGGVGGASVTSASSTPASSSSTPASSSSSGSGGGGEAETILTFYAEGNASAAAYDNLAQMTGFSNPYSEMTTQPVGLAFRGTGLGIAAIRSEPTGELRYAFYNGSWSPGFGASMLPVQPSPVVTINGGPSLAGSSAKIHAAYQGSDLKFYYAEHDGSWTATHEAIAFNNAQSTGPVPPAITTLADVPIVAFIGVDGDLYDQTRTGGVWQASHPHGVAGHGASITPAIVALTQGPELAVVYVDAAADALMSSVRTAGTWSAPAPIAGAASTDALALAPLAAGGAVLAYRGTDSHLYTTLLSAGSPPSWSTPVAGAAGVDPVLESPPAVATGAAGADAELIYLDDTYIVSASRMNGGVWSQPQEAGAASYHLAIATGH